ncbi:MAG: HEPN domain-containing protein [Gemmatimonadetes bacterium]|nr:HEPN domain-containing protein [Gemmatimonadota bacterium]
MEQKAETIVAEIEWWTEFDDQRAGEATSAAIKGRCTKCWGRLLGKLNREKRWTEIECLGCGRSVEGIDAVREADRMWCEMDNNLPAVRLGLPAEYREDAKFVLKILPDMDRDTAYFDERITAKVSEGRKKNTIGRNEFSKGTPGYLFLQACTFMAGTSVLPYEKSVIQYSDYEFETPRVSGIDVKNHGSEVRVSAEPRHRNPLSAERVMMERMGLIMISGMTVAFACELALKAILITRLDEAKKTHDLYDLFVDLPEDCKARMKADFMEIEDALKKGRHIFGRWRYFETNVGEVGMQALVYHERASILAKVARVLIDEGGIAGLSYEVTVNMDAELRRNGLDDDASYVEKYGLNITGTEAPIPWDLLLTQRSGKRP